MVNSYEVDFLQKAKIYVTRGYPSIHLYTVDEALIGYLCRRFHARASKHRETFDVAITKRTLMLPAAEFLVAQGDPVIAERARLLVEYCRERDPEKREQISLRFKP